LANEFALALEQAPSLRCQVHGDRATVFARGLALDDAGALEAVERTCGGRLRHAGGLGKGANGQRITAHVVKAEQQVKLGLAQPFALDLGCPAPPGAADRTEELIPRRVEFLAGGIRCFG
jgi:hypothetical protein